MTEATKPAVVFERLYLSNWGDGRIKGAVEFKNDIGKIELNLDPELAARVLTVCADHLINAASVAADAMKAKCVEGIAAAALLDHQEDKEHE